VEVSTENRSARALTLWNPRSATSVAISCRRAMRCTFP
jgi:hypothetical protein